MHKGCIWKETAHFNMNFRRYIVACQLYKGSYVSVAWGQVEGLNKWFFHNAIEASNPCEQVT